MRRERGSGVESLQDMFERLQKTAAAATRVSVASEPSVS